MAYHKKPTNPAETSMNASDIQLSVTRWQEIAHRTEVRSALAYLLGAYLSDGYLSWSSYTSLQKGAGWGGIKDAYFIDCIGIALSKLKIPYSFRDRVKRDGKYIQRYSIHERAGEGYILGGWLWEISGEKEELPKIPRELVRPLIAGLMDGDGGAYIQSSDQVSLIYFGKAEFIQDYRKLLTDLEIRIGPEDTQFNINIEGFLRAGLCFAMPRKQARLAYWCRRVIKTSTARGNSSDVRRAAVAKWYLREANHLKGRFAMPDDAIPQGYKRFTGGADGQKAT